MQQADLQLLAALGRDGQKAPDSPKAQVVAAAVADCVEHLDALARAAAVEGGVIPVVLDVDMSYRPLGTGPFSPHLGVRRSPLRDTAEVVALAQRIANTRGLRFHGLLFYEAQIAGLTDRNPFTRATNVVKRAIKARSGPDVVRRRKECLQALFAHGLRPQVVNGGGTGSVAFSAQDPSLTEVTIGSGFLDSLLFDYYQDLSLSPAAFFALQVVRCPAPGIVTCHGGGYVASGEAGPDRLPRPYLPDGLELLDLEGAGEVQTPLRVRGGGSSSALPCLGDPVFFRHAKAGELAEHFGEYLLVRGDRVVARAPTYRGLGQCFLG
jgi:D-serine deaminase-like pyridoxal phosphate-dependent protein